MPEKQESTGPVEYNESTAIRAYSMLTHMYQALKHIDVLAVKRVILGKMEPQNEHQRVQKERLAAVFDNTHALRESFKTTGIPRTPDEFQKKQDRAETPVAKRATG